MPVLPATGATCTVGTTALIKPNGKEAQARDLSAGPFTADIIGYIEVGGDVLVLIQFGDGTVYTMELQYLFVDAPSGNPSPGYIPA